MKIRVHTHGGIEGGERLAVHVTTFIEGALEHIRGRITRGAPPTAVACHAPRVEEAVHGAPERL